VAEATEKPIVLYNVPGRTGVNMTAETCLRLAQIPNIVAVKEASGNREQIEAILAGAPEGFQVLSGNDDDTLWMMKQGGAGVISVASNVAPALLSEFTGAIRKGDMEKAEALNEMGQTSSAETPLNIVRRRAGLPAVSGLSQGEMREKIIHERRMELAFEGHRWFDMIRINNGQYAIDFLHSIGKTNATLERLIFPIPQTERDANPLIEQNPGY
jgi:hypothetical protein